MPLPRATESRTAVLAALGLAALVLGCRAFAITSPTIVALLLLTIVLGVAAASTRRLAIATSFGAMLTFNYFFLPPVGTLTIADPQNWVALFVFLAVSLVASHLSATARARAREAVTRRDELARLFDLTRDVLLTTDSREAIPSLARYIARRFDLDHVSICLPAAAGTWHVHAGGALPVSLDPLELRTAFSGAERSLEFDARERTYAGHRVVQAGGHDVRLVPLRLGVKAIGLLAAAGRTIEPGTLDALAGITAIAIERAQFLEDRKLAELARQGEDLKSALLASLAHDLKTPLTAIRLAAGNLQAAWLTDVQRREQSEIVHTEVARLSRLFESILDMARIDAGAVASSCQWVPPADIVDAARAHVEHALGAHPIEILIPDDSADLVYLDPRLTSSALAHLLENAAAYSPPGSAVTVTATSTADGLLVTVRDRGPGISPADLPHLFDRFFRGSAAQGTPGSGMGLAIARGLLAVEDGRVWAENHPDGGALFSLAVAAPVRHQEPAVTEEAAT
jgi:two-component system sensor histidine kinase KdpD